MNYNNPVIRGFYPDPSICKVCDDYYLVTSSFEYLPGVPLFTSKNLVDWEQMGYCLTRDSQIDLHGTFCSGGIYAPTIRYYDGMFYMITTNISKGNFIVYTNDLKKGFSNPIWIDIKGIDPSLYFEDGKYYIQASCMTFIHQAEIDIKTGALLSEPKIISEGCGHRDVEAPHIYKINGWYYLMCAEGGTRDGHMVTVQRSRFLYGPYEKSPNTPMVSNKDKSKEKLQAVGHADLIQDNSGNWWIVALATRPYKHRHHLGRETILVPVIWTKDGWPMVENSYVPSEITCEGIGITKQKEESFFDDFDQNGMRADYNTIRDFIINQYSLKDKAGYLTLRGNGEDLNTLSSPVFLGVRQKEYICRFEVKLLTELEEGGTAGLAVLIDNHHHMEIGLRNSQGILELYTKRTVDDIVIITKAFDYLEEKIIIGIEADELHYKFYYISEKNEKIIINEAMVKHMSVEMSDSPFTGVFGGMFIENRGTAYFDWFKYEESPKP
ncbi:glycoside hydrolase family 43 protein [Anaerocolumna xylanovorans]|uniref:Alpha-N-arabinofuranosidase n=1 Tax=Anaerocolumna xylanovorans DSM 12503 TaxID=1121345 RepID=A0A1M7Y185_9FIRM|nr:glycoside hydrolase family 43 protein [Anaerocolumna xylanovorans]SHO45266.1 alpha-N-arabinofuranosidase [Anaerocolumna xylanovorans DSM 12503]